MSRSPVRVATLTLSDTRTLDDDEGGELLGALLTSAGFSVTSHAVLREEPELLRAAVEQIASAGSADAIITTGGTGIAPRDRTLEALAPLFEKTLDGFGEAFRRLSWDAIGPRAILSRAAAGVVRGVVVIALPGSPKAVELAVTQVIGPVLAHAVALASGEGGHHHRRAQDREQRG
ncbi:molybdenum cofactor biosynthesis protein B [Sorangium cellulosum]|uniref:Molybdenum cofactor biosynthesis protein B n=1 Tax=Sorangium cellulosum TaxID=56 RepID=A0A150PKI0_SORCE|nr:molybdenum cofactor biosynthesis protein B [Sorangium cellulosum]